MSRFGGNSESDKHGQRSFIIAMMLLFGFIVLMAIPVLRDDMASAEALAAIFSGWMAAIIGFYFMRNQAYQVSRIAEETGVAKGTGVANEIENSLDKLTKEYDEALDNLEYLQNGYNVLRKKYDELKSKSKKP